MFLSGRNKMKSFFVVVLGRNCINLINYISTNDFSVLGMAALLCAAPTPSGECNFPCHLNYDPVCAQPVTGKGAPQIFGNQCALKSYNCREENSEFIIIF